MIELNLIYFLLFFTIVTLQIIVGVGVLVLGTPLLLILQHGIIDTISILLPISILTSLINIIFFKTINKKNKIKLDKNINNFFFTLCLPAVFLGIFILKIFHELINFQILVSLIILSTLIVKIYYQNTVLNFSNLKKKIILFFIGLIHGITNSGGTILSLFVLSLNKNLKNQTRYSLTFFYFFLALFQYFIFIIAFQKILSFDLMIYLILIILGGCLCGNFLVKFIKETFFRNLIELLAFLSAMFLIINNLYF